MKAAQAYPYVHTDHPVSYALERMRDGNVDVLPVVSRASIQELCGVITSTAGILEEFGIAELSANGYAPARNEQG